MEITKQQISRLKRLIISFDIIRRLKEIFVVLTIILLKLRIISFDIKSRLYEIFPFE